MLDNETNKQRTANITYTQAGVSCFVGQESGKFIVQFFVGGSVVKIPACV
jgi:dihydroorotase-like cyclic amidohydrolase